MPALTQSTFDEQSPPRWRESDRLCALRGYGVLDTPPEESFDDLVRLVAEICDAPIAVVNLIDEARQWFKAEVGLGVRETPLETSFCAKALLQQDGMVVPDATQDPRFSCNPLVTGEMNLRFYAGVLLKTSDGLPLGTLCVLDTKVRPEGLSAFQQSALKTLAGQAMSQLELRKALAKSVVDDIARDQAESDLDEATQALAQSEAKFRAIADSMPQMVWSTLPDGFHDYYNARWYEFTGVAQGSTDGEGWAAIFHPEDQSRAWDVWRHSLATGEDYEIEYRLRRADGVYRWTLGRAKPIRNEAGEIVRWFGTCTDIDDLKRVEQNKELLSQELSHRIKNIFAVVSALIALSAREYPEAKAFAGAVRNRVGALARAHEFVRPHSEVSRPTVGGMTLHAFLEALFKPYADDSGAARVRVEGDDALFDDQAATSVALLFHELATNAAKYGALSVSEGRVVLRTELRDDRFVLVWTEMGGPTVAGEPSRVGFGTSLATLSVTGQLGGKLEQIWKPTGLIVVADLPATALSRRRAAEKAR